MKRILITSVVILMTAGLHAQTSEMIAHRGSWKNTDLPQNSIASLQAAIKQKAAGAEFDVHYTKDNILVVNHDNDFYGIDIATSTYKELLEKKHPNGESIPTAEEYIKAGIHQKDTKLIYELKTNRLGKERTIESVAKTIELVNKLNAQEYIEYIAFDYDACLELKKLNKDARVHYLSGDKSPQDIKDVGLTGIDYNSQVLKKHPEWLQQARELGLITNVWTVNSAEDMQFFIDNRVNYITTDEPELLNQLLNR